MSAADENRPPLHEATLRLLSLLASSRLEKDLLQKGIEALAAILQVRYGAIGLVNDDGKLEQFVYTGISPEQAERIGKLPEGRGLLGIPIPLRLSDMRRDPRSVGFPPNHPPMKSLLSVSFAHEGRNYGRVYLSEKNDGSNFSPADEQILSHFASVFAMMLALHRAQNERERSAAELREISHALSAITGEAFFRELVQNLARALGVAFAIVGEVADAGLSAVRTVAVCADGKLAENFIYDLAGTPCANVVDKELCYHARDVQALFPDDRMLAEMGIESYVGSPLFDSTGKPLGILVLLDRKPLADPEHAAAILKISAARVAAELERRRQDQVLQQSEANLRALAENAGEGILVNREGRHVFANRRLAEMLGYTRAEDLLDTTIRDVVHPDELVRVRERYEQRLAGGTQPARYETVFVTKQGEALPVEISAAITVWQGKRAGLIFVHDITARRQSEQALRDSEQRFRQMAENIREVFWMTDTAKNQMLYISPTYEEIWGRSCRSLYENPRNWLEAIHPEDRGRVLQAALTRQTNGDYREEYRIVRPDGTLRWIRDRAFPVLDDTGKPYRIAGVAEDITVSREAEEALQTSHEILERIFDSTHFCLAYLDRDFNFIRVNRAYARACDRPVEYFPGKNHFRLFPNRENEEIFRSVVTGGVPFTAIAKPFEFPDHPEWGVTYWDWTLHPLKNAGGEVEALLFVLQDVTQRIRAEDIRTRFGRILDASSNEYYIFDASTLRFTQVNQGAQQNLGYTMEELRKLTPLDVKPELDRESFEALMKPLRDGTEQKVAFVTTHRRKDGSTYPVEVQLQLSRDDHPMVFVAVIQDITERRRTEERLSYLAYFDSLTGLPNREQLHEHIKWAMNDAAHHERLMAVLFLDLDRFKNINDTLGHDIGDALLKEVATRLRHSVRPGDIISRLGGDEFTLVLANVAHVDDVTRVAQKILDQFAAPFRVAGRDLFVTPSIGITLYPLDDDDPDNLLKNADIAMYHAKELGRNNFQYFTPKLNTLAARRLELETGLRRALENGEFILHYQPLVKMDSGRITGMEALLRWQHPEHGLIPPMEFIPLAEETGLIVPIGEWVLREACRQIKAWHDTGFPPMHVAVNLSSVQLQQKNFAAVVKRALTDSGLEPQYLDLELTESLLMQDMEAAESILKELNDYGVLFSLDDFGTGYSSLSYLKRFPIDFLKIDRSFVRDIVHDRYGAGIVRAIIVMAHTLNIKVIAEGVESLEHLRFLRRQDCDISQGYYCSEPLATETFTELLHDWKRIRMGRCRIRQPAAAPHKPKRKSPSRTRRKRA